ncbi:acyltransferase family protein [Pseudooceanicola algae]|uniref:Acyltransferase 3 domain-containing protein n=1 Tax=Pseudooceanicola algae TaxID=1537215 RepID=A0A418SD60_9RHOB|nr:acyltransferase [Pseudooceanicola algae]QPM92547.1 hypothetical protein PSAL_038110 [Pseudooceanicola algae]
MVEQSATLGADSATPAAAKRKSIATLQVMRGIAAVAVVFYHVYIILMEPEYGAEVLFRPVARYGFLGVSFFFVLSGFIIFMAHRRDLGRPGSIPVYLYKRAARVYPAYWIYLTLFLVAAAMGIGYPDFSWAPLNLASSYILFPLVEDMTLPLKVAWTLVYEIRFYLIFVLLLVFGARMLWAFVGWGVAILVCFLAGIDVPDVMSVWNLYFLAGMLGYLVLDRIPERAGGLIFGLGVALFVLYGALSTDVGRIADLAHRAEGLHFLLAPTFLALILGGILLERRHEIRFPSILMLLGDASYSIYLVHSAVISATFLIGGKVGLITLMGLHAFFIFAFVFAVLCGTIAYLVIERPLIHLSRRLLG